MIEILNSADMLLSQARENVGRARTCDGAKMPDEREGHAVRALAQARAAVAVLSIATDRAEPGALADLQRAGTCRLMTPAEVQARILQDAGGPDETDVVDDVRVERAARYFRRAAQAMGDAVTLADGTGADRERLLNGQTYGQRALDLVRGMLA